EGGHAEMLAAATTGTAGRLRLLWWTFALAWLALAGLGLASVLLMLLALISVGGAGVPLTVGALPWLHGFADWHRARFARLAGVRISRPYLPDQPGGWTERLIAAARDPASWRDAAWLLVNGTAGATLCLLSLSLFAAGVFYVL